MYADDILPCLRVCWEGGRNGWQTCKLPYMYYKCLGNFLFSNSILPDFRIVKSGGPFRPGCGHVTVSAKGCGA